MEDKPKYNPIAKIIIEGEPLYFNKRMIEIFGTTNITSIDEFSREISEWLNNIAEGESLVEKELWTEELKQILKKYGMYIEGKIIEKENKKFDSLEELLREILFCLNQIPNKRVNSNWFEDTYEICSEIGKYI